MLGEKILVTTELSENESFPILENGILMMNDIYPNNIVSAFIIGDNNQIRINPPIAWLRLGKSRIKGIVTQRGKETLISLKFYPSWLLLALGSTWLLFLLCSIFINSSLINNPIIGLINIPFVILVIKIKLNWDRRRFEKIISDKIRIAAKLNKSN